MIRKEAVWTGSIAQPNTRTGSIAQPNTRTWPFL